MKRQLAIIVMVVMVLTIMSVLASCGPECAHQLTKFEKTEATCAQKGNDEYYVCTECGGIFSDALAENSIEAPVTYEKLEHPDADKNHVCDACDEIVGDHATAEGKHECGYCGQTMTNCMDADKNHACDTCGAAVGKHEAAEGKHNCDYCGEALTECQDADDHKCDICGKTVSRCADADTNHACDVCGAEMGVHEANAGGHSCDYCGGPVTDCTDDDYNHECDVCGYPVGEHVEGDGHWCTYCWTIVSDCYDNDKNHACDICETKMGIHKPPKDGHACEYCGYVYSVCSPEADDGDCTTPRYCTVCGEIAIEALEHNIDWKRDDNNHWGDCVNEGCDHSVAATPHYSYKEGECECGLTCEDKCDVCGNCLDESCILCKNKCEFINMNNVIPFAPGASLYDPEGPDGQANGYINIKDSATVEYVVLPNGAHATLVTLPSGAVANSGFSFLNNGSQPAIGGLAGFNCGVPLIDGRYTNLRMHFTNTGDSEVTFKFSNIDYYYDYGAATVTLKPGETKSVLIRTSHGDSVGLNSQIIFTKEAAAGASVAMWGEFVANENLASISIAAPAVKLQYVVGDTFSAEGLILKANGTNYSRVYISGNYVTNLDGYTFTADDIGTKAVIVEFGGKLLWYTVEIADHIHNIQYFPESAPVACEKDGLAAHYACTHEGCGLYFTDETGNATTSAPKKISCHTAGDESKVLPGMPIPCANCGAAAGVRDMTNWVYLNLTTSTSSIGSNIKNGKIEQAEVNGMPGTKFYIGAGTKGATNNSAFYLKMSDNDANRQTVIPNRGNNTPAGQNRKVILYYENYGDEAITMNLQNDASGGNGKITIPAHGTAISTFEIRNTGGSNWFHFYVDYNATKDTSFGVYGYFYVYDGETNAPSINKSAEKLTYKVGETFSSEGLVLNAAIPSSVTKTVYVQSGYTTNYDGYTFTKDDVGTHTVTVSFAGKTTSYTINVEDDSQPTYDCANGLHNYAMVNDEALFDKMDGSDAYYFAKCALCGEKSSESYAVSKISFVPHHNIGGGHRIEYVTLEDGRIAAKLTFNSDVAKGTTFTITANSYPGNSNVCFPVKGNGRRVYMEMTSSADITLTWQPEFYGDRDGFTFDLKADVTSSGNRIIKYDTTAGRTESDRPYQEIVAGSDIKAGTVVYLTGYFYAFDDVTGLSVNTTANSTVFRVGETFSSEGLSLKADSSDSLYANVKIYNVTTNLDGYTFKAEDYGKLIEVVAYVGNAKVSYYIVVA